MGKRPSDKLLREFKKTRMSRIDDSLDWEHFQDFVTECPDFSIERVQLIKQLFAFSDLPMPKILNMYS